LISTLCNYTFQWRGLPSRPLRNPLPPIVQLDKSAASIPRIVNSGFDPLAFFIPALLALHLTLLAAYRIILKKISEYPETHAENQTAQNGCPKKT
jgi:hypothetical protein